MPNTDGAVDQTAPGSPSRSGPPIDPRLVARARATRRYFVAGVIVASITAVVVVIQARVLSQAIARVVDHKTTDGLATAAIILAVVFGARALLTWFHSVIAHRTAATVKSQLRLDVIRSRLARPSDREISTPALVTLVTRGIDALDGFYGRYLPQLVMAVTVPIIIIVAIVTADWSSAAIVAITIPLIPVFMILVGWSTEARTRRRWKTQLLLARHFADLVAGLPTLQVFGRARAQADGLRRTEGVHRQETMGTLRVSFLSALVLELLATLSVAVVAVTAGFRVVHGDLDLATSLFILILAPEAYQPVRQVGVHYHDAADGMAAAESAFSVIDAEPVTTPTAPSATGPLVELSSVTFIPDGATTPIISDVSMTIERGEIVVLTGPSGAGKTTIITSIAGLSSPTSGTLVAPPRSSIAYVAQHPGMIAGTVADNVRLGAPDATDDEVRHALDRVGAHQLELDHDTGGTVATLSAGEQRRVAMARAVLRVTKGGAILLVVDEPTAGLDADTERTLIETLRSLDTTAIVVSHREAVIDAADREIIVEGRRS